MTEKEDFTPPPEQAQPTREQPTSELTQIIRGYIDGHDSWDEYRRNQQTYDKAMNPQLDEAQMNPADD